MTSGIFAERGGEAVSIIIPTFNRAALIPRAIASALSASEPGDEIIIVDDGSTDRTEDAVAPYKDKVRYLRVLNGGVGRARNIGIKEAIKPLVAFLDSDDEWMPDKLELQRTVMRVRPEVLFCFSDFTVRTAGAEYPRYLINWHQDPRSWNDILGPGVSYSFLSGGPAPRPDFQVHCGDLFLLQMAALYVFTSTLLVRREAARNALRFPEDITIYEDWECYGRLAQAGLGAYLDCETAWNHGHGGVRLTDAPAIDRATARIVVLERVWGEDHAFLAKHGAQYQEILVSKRLSRIKELISAGRTREAGRELRFIQNAPVLFRIGASLPGALVQGIVKLRRTLRAFGLGRIKKESAV